MPSGYYEDMSAHVWPRLTPEEYLAMERAAEWKSEYYDGRMYAMSGVSHAHAIIVTNFLRNLPDTLGDRPCLVTASDLRVRVQPGGLYTYPDVVVVCGEPKFADDQRDTLLNPIVIGEVLSPSTERYDRVFKSAQYRSMESLQEYMLIWQAAPRIEVLRRQSGDNWLVTEFDGLDAICRLESVDCSLPLSAIYKNIIFGNKAPAR